MEQGWPLPSQGQRYWLNGRLRVARKAGTMGLIAVVAGPLLVSLIVAPTGMTAFDMIGGFVFGCASFLAVYLLSR